MAKTGIEKKGVGGEEKTFEMQAILSTQWKK